MRIAERVRTLPPYLFADIERQIAERQAAGIDVISLGIGDPDLPTPAHIVDGAATARRATRHPPVPEQPGRARLPRGGRRLLRSALRRRSSTRRPRSCRCSAPRRASPTSAMAACSTPATSRSAATPATRCTPPVRCWPAAAAVPLPLRAGARLPARPRGDRPLTSCARAKMLFVSYPNNPTGAVVEDDFFARLVRLRQAPTTSSSVHDNAYADVTYDGYVAPSFLADARRQGRRRRDAQPLQELQHDRLAHRRRASATRGGRRRATGASRPTSTPACSPPCSARRHRGAQRPAGVRAGDVPHLPAPSRPARGGAARRRHAGATPPKGTIYLWVPVPDGYTSASFTRAGARPGGRRRHAREPPTAPPARATCASRSRCRTSASRRPCGASRSGYGCRGPQSRAHRERLMGAANGADTGATTGGRVPSSSRSCPAAHGEPGEDEPLTEIKELLRSADMEWVADVIQHRDAPNPRTYLGKGKMSELKAAITENAGDDRRLRGRSHARPRWPPSSTPSTSTCSTAPSSSSPCSASTPTRSRARCRSTWPSSSTSSRGCAARAS